MDGSEAEAIRDLHARYADAVWRKDFSAFGECFTAEAEWRVGGLELHGRMAITATIEKILANFRKVLLNFHAPILSRIDGSLVGRTYVTEQVSRTDGTANVSIGRYYERFVLDDGRWRFAWRLFQLHYSGPPDLSGTYYEHEDYGAPPGMPPADALSGDFAAAKWGI